MLTILAVPMVIGALWVQMVLLDSTAFVEMSDDMLEEKDVRAAVSETIVSEVEANFPEIDQPGVRPLLTRAVAAAIDTAAFRQIFGNAVFSTHQQLANGEPEVTLGLGDVLPLVARELPAIPLIQEQLAARSLPITVTIAERETRPELWILFRVVRDGSIAILVGFLAATLAIGVISPTRGTSLALLGFCGAALAVLTVVIAPTASSPITAGYEPVLAAGIDSAWGVVARSVYPIGIGVVVLLLALGVTGVAWAFAARKEPPGRRVPRRAIY